MNKQLRCHFTMVIEGTLKYSWLILFYAFTQIISEPDMVQEGGHLLIDGMALFIGLSILLCLTAVIFLSQWVKWLTTFYVLDDLRITYRTGLLFRRHVVLPYEKISTVDISSNLLEQIFSTAKLKINSEGNATKNLKKSEIELVLTSQQATDLRLYLLTYKGDSTRDAQIFSENKAASPFAIKATIKDHLLAAFCQSKLVYLVAIFPILTVVLSFFGGEEERFISDLIARGQLLEVWIVFGLIMLSMLIIWLLGFAVNLISNMIRYHQFTLWRMEDTIKIEYGFITRKSVTLPLHRIHAIQFSQNLLMQVFHLSVPIVCSVGYGAENEQAMLFPLLNRRSQAWVMEYILPELACTAASLRPPRRTFRFFLLVPTLILLGISLVFWLFSVWLGLLLSLTAAFLAISRGVLSYHNAALAFDDSVVMAQKGGFSKTSLLVRLQSVQTVTKRQSPFQRRKKASSVLVDLFNTISAKQIKVPHLDDGDVVSVIDLISKQ